MTASHSPRILRQPSAAYAAFSSPWQSPPAYVPSPSTSPSPCSANTEASESSTTGAMTACLTRSDSTARGFSLVLSLCYRGLTSEPSLPTNTANTISPLTSPSPHQHIFRWQCSHPSSLLKVPICESHSPLRYEFRHRRNWHFSFANGYPGIVSKTGWPRAG